MHINKHAHGHTKQRKMKATVEQKILQDLTLKFFCGGLSSALRGS